MFYKFIDETCVYKCPKNGIIERRAISNLPRYFEINPSAAIDNGYKKLAIDENTTNIIKIICTKKENN